MIKVAHVLDGLGSGGAEALLATNLRAFKGAPFEHLVITLFEANSPSYPTTHFWERPITELGIPVLSLSARTKADLPDAVRQLRALLRAHRVDVVHTHLLWAGLVGRLAARLSGTPVASSIHLSAYEPEVISGYRAPYSPKHMVMRGVEALSLRQADAVVAVGSTVLQNALVRLRVPASRARVILNPVDFSALDQTPVTPRELLLSELGLTRDVRLLVNVGRLVPQKNQVGLVEELAPLLREDPTLHLVVLGAQTDAAYTESTRRAVKGFGLDAQVHLLGARRDVTSWLSAASLFVFPSAYEGLPVALIEATALGCACVVSDIAPNREIVENRKTGLLPDLGTPGAFRAAVSSALHDANLARSLGERARAATRARFTAEASVAALTSLYSDLCSPRARTPPAEWRG